MTRWTRRVNAWQPKPEEVKKDTDARLGGLAANWSWQFNWANELNAPQDFFYWTLDALALMFVGAALVKWGVIQGDRAPAFYLALAATGYLVGISLNIAESWPVWTSQFKAPIVWAPLTHQVSRIAVTFGHLGLILLILGTAVGRRVLHPFAAVGRLALSNYIAQTLICQWLLFPGIRPGAVRPLRPGRLWLIVLGRQRRAGSSRACALSCALPDGASGVGPTETLVLTIADCRFRRRRCLGRRRFRNCTVTNLTAMRRNCVAHSTRLTRLLFPLTSLAQQNGQQISLWPNGAPGSEARRAEPEQAKDYWVKNIHDPSITVYLPPKDKATGAGVVVIPGGGHRLLVFKAEGVEPAEYLNSLGVAAFVLKHRLQREEGSTYTIERDARGRRVPRDENRAQSRGRVWRGPEAAGRDGVLGGRGSGGAYRVWQRRRRPAGPGSRSTA